MKKYFLYDGTTQHGPFDLAELETKIITAQTMVWHESLPEWKPAGEIEELKNFLNSKVPASQILTPPIITVKEEDWSKKSYYYTDDHGQQGPFTYEQLKSRPIKANTPVWYDPLPEWTTADKVAGLKYIINGTPNVPAPVAPQKKFYYYMDNGVQRGPFTQEQLKGKPITSATLIWYDPLPEWIKAGQEEGLKDIINQAAGDWAKTLFYYTDSGGRQGPFTLEQLKGKPITAATAVWYHPLVQWTTAGQVDILKTIIANNGV
jgi:hypothetical protein